MSTVVRPELSIKNKYWIDRHRYYELKHFCLQYPLWKRMRAEWDGMSKSPRDLAVEANKYMHGDPTAKCVEARAFYNDRIDMIEKAAREADTELADYICKAVTRGLSYEALKLKYKLPCGRDM